jgi:hypothetical protein
LLYSAAKEQRKELLIPGSIFAIAALGGTYLFTRDLMGNRPQTSVTAIHATAAVTGFSILATQAFLSGKKQKQIPQLSEMH